MNIQRTEDGTLYFGGISTPQFILEHPQLDATKGAMCIDIAQVLLSRREVPDMAEELIRETAIDLMSIPTMNIERIHKRLGLDQEEKSAVISKLNRFQILKEK